MQQLDGFDSGLPKRLARVGVNTSAEDLLQDLDPFVEQISSLLRRDPGLPPLPDQLSSRFADRLLQLRTWCREGIRAKRSGSTGPGPHDPESPDHSNGAGATPDDLVTLDQAAAAVSQSKRTLERYVSDGKLPAPDFPGGGGKANRWYWSKILPALREHFHPDLPDRFPGSRIL
jgi:hypothetical protein